MVKTRGARIHHAYTYGGEILKLIAVKLADRKCGKSRKENPALGTTRILSESSKWCQENKSINLNPARFTAFNHPELQRIRSFNASWPGDTAPD